QPPPHDVIDVMADRGIDVSSCRAQALSLEQIVETDLLLTMALHQSRRVLIQAQMLGWKVFTLKEFVLCAEGMNGDGHHISGDLQSYLGKCRGLEGMKYLMKGKTLPDLLEQHEFANHEFVQHFFRLQHHIYSEDLTIDDPMGQSRAFMDRTADEIQEYVERLYPLLEHIVEYR
ncbi:MAG: low molecular weight phosphatase family protein, partial [Candidatus Geothermincolia bacterium]